MNEEQALEALAKGTDVRLARAADKRRIKRGELSAASVLRDLPLHWQSARVVDLLLCMDRVGRTKAGRWLALEKADPSVRLRDLTLRQRLMLSRHVDVEIARYERARQQIST